MQRKLVVETRRELEQQPSKLVRFGEMFETDENGRPVIKRMAARIGDLEHRLDYLERTYDPNKEGHGKNRIEGEMYALHAALIVMRYHELEVGGEHSVVLALEGLVQAHDMPSTRDNAKGKAMTAALAEARAALEALR